MDSDKKYPVFVFDHFRTLFEIINEDEDEQLYTQELLGIPFSAYDLEKGGFVSNIEITDPQIDIYSFDEICEMPEIFYTLNKIDETLGDSPNDIVYINLYLGKGYDMRKAYIAQLRCFPPIFGGAEIILCKKFLNDISDRLHENLYLYLHCIDFILILPESAIIDPKGIVNFMIDIKFRDKLPEFENRMFGNKIFYYDRKTASYKEIMHNYIKLDYEL